jgi:hypothetical protein
MFSMSEPWDLTVDIGTTITRRYSNPGFTTG